jgi:putative transposase
MKYAFIRSNAARYPVIHLCRLLGVKRSAYYSWRSRPAKIIGPEELELRRRMKALFAESRGSLGSRMMTANLCLEGFAIGRKRVRDLMKILDLKVKRKRKYQITTDSRRDYPIADNVLNRAFHPTRRIKSGALTLRICGPKKVGSTLPSSLICTPVAWSAGPWTDG